LCLSAVGETMASRFRGRPVWHMEVPDTLVLCSPSDVAVVSGMPSTSVVGVAVGWGSSPRGHV
jgi:hypothetical protein